MCVGVWCVWFKASPMLDSFNLFGLNGIVLRAAAVGHVEITQCCWCRQCCVLTLVALFGRHPLNYLEICGFALFFFAVVGPVGVPAGVWPPLFLHGVPALVLPE